MLLVISDVCLSIRRTYSKMSASRVAVVTGSNKGIGYAIVKALCQQSADNTIVYITARNTELGQQAIDSLSKELNEKERAKLRLHQLDITDMASIRQLRDHLQHTYGGVDVLVNNAGFAFKNAATEPMSVQAHITIGINYRGTRAVCEQLFPLLRPHARVVSVCSQAGIVNDRRYSLELRRKLADPKLTIDDIDRFVDEFIRLTQTDEHQSGGYPNSTYCVSKAAEIAMTMIQHREMTAKRPNDDIIINACCPGYVSTDMTSHKGTLTIEEGAETPVYLALLPPNVGEPNGKFVFQKKPMEWIVVN